jgi:hypothetical protein
MTEHEQPKPSEIPMAVLLRNLGEAAILLAEAVEEDDQVLGLLSSRGFVYAAAAIDEVFWETLRGEVAEARAEAVA